MTDQGRWRIGLFLVLLATAARLAWVLAVPTIVVGDFATYRESAIYLAEFGRLDSGFVYMPGLVLLLAALHSLGGEVLAAKLLGVAFGGLAAGPVFLITAKLIEGRQARPEGQAAAVVHAERPRGWGRDDGALAAGLAYALWPAGVAVSSVIGTDIPTAAIILLALALLCQWGGTRPVLAAAAFGAAMGLAAYFRAVALPLSVLSAGYWLAIRAGTRVTVTRTAVAAAMTVLMLLPWGLRNRRVNGEFYLTDSHGGITALMGNDPNTEGTYSRSLGILFRQLTGRTFLMEPHRVTDEVAYDLAKRWITFEPAWTAGMIALRIERLFAAERGLLYWSVYRRGVVPPATAAWFNQHRPVITGLADLFYLFLLTGVVAGLAYAMVERRWIVLVPLPFALALAGTYALFVAEPRYRLTTEALLFPIFGFGAMRIASSIRRGGISLARLAARQRGWLIPRGLPTGWRSSATVPGAQFSAADRRGLNATLMGLAVLSLLSVAIVRGGAALRTRYRWAATVWTVDERPQLAMWRAAVSDGGPSGVRSAAPGAALLLPAAVGEVGARIVLSQLVLQPGLIKIDAEIRWPGTVDPGVALTMAGSVAAGGTPHLSGSIAHAGGPLWIEARLKRSAPASGGDVQVVISDVVLTTITPR